ncbi:large conductance mechanosensitive channel [Prosthecobacter fusiformis]|uniref:Large-conductance mechanosensitive channel n=1 Tax=Prosthecobacter fusiformis TaxID=48464 RepID=A0A4V3FE95_9BACT|nr:MscL family protein [Prosthecobacter fusiformis]TDU66143.1 large conductance mechanosensitive channel [Prosthecobacter fusiformis]
MKLPQFESPAMLDEFKKFILKGNVVSLSTGVIIGSAFNNIVTAFTKGIVEPILAIFGGNDLGTSNWKFKIWEKMATVTEKVNGVEVKTEKMIPVLLDVGAIIGSVIGFLITAAIVFFIIVKPTNKLLDLVVKKDTPPAALPPDVALLTEIRDMMKRQEEAANRSQSPVL